MDKKIINTPLRKDFIFKKLIPLINDEDIDIDEKSSVDDIWRLLTDSKQIEFDNVMATINMEYVKKDKKPKEGDEIAFFPPVTGG